MEVGSAGRFIIYAAAAASVWACASSIAGWRRRDQRLADSARRAIYSATGLLGVAAVVLVGAMFAHDFSIEYVANYTSRSTPPLFTFTALWAGMEGSLLFWTLLTAMYSTVALAVHWRRRAELIPLVTAILGAILAFFCILLSFGASPFSTLSPIPRDGSGLNPLLQSPFMAIHPVLLYLGFTGFAVPFAFAAASLVAGRLDFRWFTSTRRWTILSWSFLTVGIVLGAAWAYHELGWGGYWAWDPVENASLLPWLTGTAFLHSVMIQERRGMLKVWNAALILGTYALAIFGTFLTRSGLLSSVHTFSESPIGKYFLPFLALILIGSFVLLGWRADRLKSDRHLDSVVSRESMFLFNNLLFVAIAFTVLWGTLYPILVEAIRGVRISVGAPYFNSVVVPLGLALLALTGIGPLVAWRRASAENLKRHLLIPFAVGALAAGVLTLLGVHSAGALLAFSLCAFVAAATVGEFIRGARAHRRVGEVGFGKGLARLIGRNRRRYGGYIIHLGVVLVFIGLAGAAFRQSWSGTVEVGESFRIGDYSITYVEPKIEAGEEKMMLMAIMKVARDGKPVATLRPQRNFHFAQQQPQSEVGLLTNPVEDLYLALTQMDRDRTATVRAWVNPLVMWIWIGGVVMTAGIAVILSARPAPETAESQAKARERREVVRV
ncbi:MAG: heme lyase CcmF/NrfE family subunit [Actinomycetota bacterium]